VTIREAVSTGDHTKALVALRDHLAERLESAANREAAPLARQLRDVLAELDAEPSEGANPVDDLAARRTARRSASGAAGS
jgi:hypothetical protein